jgi:hypothetical protein
MTLSSFSVKEFRKVPGWFGAADQLIFQAVLEMQETGDLLEIGVYQGKSAIFIENFRRPGEIFEVCDVFDQITQPEENDREIKSSYINLSLNIFSETFLKFHKSVPKIHVCDSLDLHKKVKNTNYRFIHIDGSHLYQYVKNDLDFSIAHLRSSDGIIAVDDFRAAHTLGVAAAVWEKVGAGELIPLIVTGTKAYFGVPGNRFSVPELINKCASLGLNSEIVQLQNMSVVRVVTSGEELFNERYRTAKRLFPPLVLDGYRYLRKILS